MESRLVSGLRDLVPLALALAVPAATLIAHAGLLAALPLLVVVVPLLCGRYPGSRALARLAARHLRDYKLPDSAIDVIDEAGAVTKLKASAYKAVPDEKAEQDQAQGPRPKAQEEKAEGQRPKAVRQEPRNSGTSELRNLRGPAPDRR